MLRCKSQNPAEGVGQTAWGPDIPYGRRGKIGKYGEHPGSYDRTPSPVYATRGLGNTPEVFFFNVLIT